MVGTDYASVLGQLREQIVLFRQSAIYRDIVGPRDAVFARFQPIFSPEHVPAITAEEFLSFLPLGNNRHWSGLHRQGSRIVADMEKLRTALSILLDEDQPIAPRYDQATKMVHGRGKNIATAILLIAYPDKYGVWNNRSVAVLRRLGLWPSFEWGTSRGARYALVNAQLLRLRDDLEVDLWTLDALWWFLDDTQTKEPIDDELAEVEGEEQFIALVHKTEAQRFGLERHLHAFLRDNWSRLDLAREWQIHSEEGEEETGVEYPTDVGRIDILAKHRHEPRWLVIELKRERSADKTVGQLLRYMGWVKIHLATADERVSGLIISRTTERSLPYALAMIPEIELRTYEVEFTLRPPEPL